MSPTADSEAASQRRADEARTKGGPTQDPMTCARPSTRSAPAARALVWPTSGRHSSPRPLQPTVGCWPAYRSQRLPGGHLVSCPSASRVHELRKARERAGRLPAFRRPSLREILTTRSRSTGVRMRLGARCVVNLVRDIAALQETLLFCRRYGAVRAILPRTACNPRLAAVGALLMSGPCWCLGRGTARPWRALSRPRPGPQGLCPARVSTVHVPHGHPGRAGPAGGVVRAG
jgi:hypothetical protein